MLHFRRNVMEDSRLLNTFNAFSLIEILIAACICFSADLSISESLGLFHTRLFYETTKCSNVQVSLFYSLSSYQHCAARVSDALQHTAVV